MTNPIQNEFDDEIPMDGGAEDAGFMEELGNSMPKRSGVPVEANMAVADGMSMMEGSFNRRDGVSMAGSPTSDANGMGKDDEGLYDHLGGGDMDPDVNGGNTEGETGHGGDDEEHPEVMSPEMAAIIRQAKNELEKNLNGTRDLAEALFAELTAFLEESEAIQKDMGQVQNIVHAESARLDDLEPQVSAFSASANVH